MAEERILKIPSVEEIEEVITAYTISGKHKTTLTSLKLLVTDFSGKNKGVIVEMDNDTYLNSLYSIREIGKLKLSVVILQKEVEVLKNTKLITIIKDKIKQQFIKHITK